MNPVSACFGTTQCAPQHLISVMHQCLWSLAVPECFLSVLALSLTLSLFAKCILSARDSAHTHKHVHAAAVTQ